MYIYVLSGTKGGYVGITSNLGRRVAEHLYRDPYSFAIAGKNIKLEHWWNVDTRQEASKIENFLHKLQCELGNSIIWEIILDMPFITKSFYKEVLEHKMPVRGQTNYSKQGN